MKNLTLVLLLLCGTVAAQERTWDTLPHSPDHYRERTARFEKEPVSTGRILFLGNSITEGGDWKTLLGDSTVINRGIGGDITFGLLQRLGDVIRRKPAKVFLMIGINDLSKDIPDAVIIENIFTLVRELRAGSPATKVFVQSLLPTNEIFLDFPKHYHRDAHVVAINGQLQRYADRFGYTFVNLYPRFLDGEGRLSAAYSHDGLHLNEAGYRLWIEILKTSEYL